MRQILIAIYDISWALHMDSITQWAANRLNARGWWWQSDGWVYKPEKEQ